MIRRILDSLSPGVRYALVVLSLLYLADAVLRFVSFDLAVHLGMNTQKFLHGEIWRLVSYALIPQCFFTFLFNLIAFAVLATRIEQSWSRLELFSFCCICAISAGLAWMVFVPRGAGVLLGLGPVVYGLLAGWIKLFGNEEVTVIGFGTTTVRQMVIIIALVSLAVSVASGAGFLDLAIPLGGAFGAWLYLIVRWRKNMSVSGREAVSGRINRLEL